MVLPSGKSDSSQGTMVAGNVDPRAGKEGTSKNLHGLWRLPFLATCKFGGNSEKPLTSTTAFNTLGSSKKTQHKIQCYFLSKLQQPCNTDLSLIVACQIKFNTLFKGHVVNNTTLQMSNTPPKITAHVRPGLQRSGRALAQYIQRPVFDLLSHSK